MSSDSDMLKWVKANLLSQSTYVTTEDNLLMGESFDFLNMDTDQFPRIEMQIVGSNGREFVTQCVRSRDCIISLQGYMKRGDRPYADQDMFDIADFKAETERIIYSIHNQVLAGAPDLPANFIQLLAMTEAYIVHEIEPNVSSFLFNFTAEFEFQ